MFLGCYIAPVRRESELWGILIPDVDQGYAFDRSVIIG